MKLRVISVANCSAAFTLIELLITITIAGILAVVAMPIYSNLQVSSQLNESSSLLIQTLRTARQNSLAGIRATTHGVYLTDNGYVLYQGSSYATRESIYDKQVDLDNTISLSWNLTGGANEIVFSQNLGIPDVDGYLVLTHEISGTRSISINSLGIVEEF